ncbi:CAAX protease self-immunity [Clostridium collagenovorans DSM 3089]|uniref:CAAX protease self-immunity n=1 Tax=Clostridium collagenovorans DSM 3089 TaxID=1121306 RepID=A0A1M5X695_9CLOT|nr:type II CAAX endopeptidase family protein [Clostridium collagenovorans]SHH95024.1 CAAX protease self-immunity [Clostridium collagenovorans DSM 3089]
MLKESKRCNEYKDIFNTVSYSLMVRILAALALNSCIGFISGLFKIPKSNYTVFWISQAIITISITYIAIYSSKLSKSIKLSDALKKPKVPLKDFIKILFICISIVYLVGVVFHGIKNVQNNSISSTLQLSFSTKLPMIFSFLTLCIIIPFCEEVLFRGYIQGALVNMSPMTKIVITSLLFALIHSSVSQVIFAFALGSIFSIITIKYESILPSSIIHMCINTLSFIENLLIYKEYNMGLNILHIFSCITVIMSIIYGLVFLKNHRSKLSLSKIDFKLFKCFFTCKYCIVYVSFSIFYILMSAVY